MPATIITSPTRISMLSLLSSKLKLIGLGILAFLLGLVKYLSARNKSLRNEVKTVKADLQFRKDVDIIDAEIEQEFSHRAEEARKDVEQGDIPSHLSDPDKL